MREEVEDSRMHPETTREISAHPATYQKNTGSWPAFLSHGATYSVRPPKIATVRA